MKIMVKFAILILAASILNADQKRLDNPFETKDIYGSVGRGDVVWKGRGLRIEPDYSDFVNGQFSVVYTADSNTEKEVGFMTAPYALAWDAGFDWQLVMMVKTNNKIPGTWALQIIDEKGGRATSEFPAVTQSEWTAVSFKASDFNPGYRQFDFSKIISFQMRAAMEKGSKLWFDDIHFLKSNGTIFGVSEKNVDQLSRDEAASQSLRINTAISKAELSTSRSSLNPYFAKLYLNREVDAVNNKLLEIFTSQQDRNIRQYGINQLWHLSLDSMLNRMYHTFGKNSSIFPGRLKPETEEALLNLIWTRNVDRNDISLAKQSSWWLAANESSDIITKASALLSSQIFINEPLFSSRPYPDRGTGGGYGYWFHNTEDAAFIGPEGLGKSKDANQYYASDHYYAYLEYFKEYFRQRSKKGFFIENGSPIYAKFTLMPIYDIYSMCEDRQLRELAGKFLDLYWAVWAQDQVSGIRGGAKIRDLGTAGTQNNSDYVMAAFHLGCGGDAEQVTLSQLLSGYRLPNVVWSIALDRKGLGDFAFVSRVPGEEENVLPRPAGNERTIMCDTESRLLRYSWVTPDYVLGCRMDYPTAVHSYLSASGTKYGVSFSNLAETAVFPWSIDINEGNRWTLAKESGNFRTAQHKNVLIFQQARAMISVSPEWFPQTSQLSAPIGIYISPSIKAFTEKDGWVFIEEGNTYLAIRVIKGEFTADYRGGTDWFDFKATESPYANTDKDSYDWNSDKTIMRLKDIYSPVILHTASKKEYPSLDAFIEHIFAGQVRLLKTVVPGWYILQYTPAAQNEENIKITFNMANSQIPEINGQYINYRPEKLFDSPFIQCDYNSGIIKISKDDYVYELNFN